jgi:alpha-methylacyl-CoA racemase
MDSPILQGRTVVSLAMNVPGPLACSRMVRLGARVVKVEPPGGDPLEEFCRKWYRALSEDHEIVRIDLKREEGRRWLATALARADVLLTSMRPAALKRLSLDRPSLEEKFPHLSHLAIVGHPAPTENLAGHDLTYLAEAGLLRPPRMPATLAADFVAAERVVSGILQLIMAGARGFAERYLEVVISEAAHDLAIPLSEGLTKATGLLGGVDPFYNLYPTASGWIAVAALEPHFRARLIEGLQCEATSDSLTQAFGKRTALEWEKWARKKDVPVMAVRTG